MSSVRVVAVAVIAALVVAVAGCTSNKTGTSTARPAQSGSNRVTTPTPISPSTGPITTPSVPTGTVPPITTSPPQLSRTVLGPDGFGAVKLGMTLAQAQATHLVSTPTTELGQTSSTGRLLAAPSDGSPSLFFSPTLGLAAIDAYPGITTPAGIKIGSTLAQLQLAYPTWQGLQGNEGPGYV